MRALVLAVVLAGVGCSVFQRPPERAECSDGAYAAILASCAVRVREAPPEGKARVRLECKAEIDRWEICE